MQINRPARNASRLARSMRDDSIAVNPNPSSTRRSAAPIPTKMTEGGL